MPSISGRQPTQTPCCFSQYPDAAFQSLQLWPAPKGADLSANHPRFYPQVTSVSIRRASAELEGVAISGRQHVGHLLIAQHAHPCDKAAMAEASIKDGDWYAVVPCCPHCRRSNVPRSPHRTSLCVECMKSAGIVRRTEPLPAILSPRSFLLFKSKPQKWLALNVGASHVKELPDAMKKAEPHRLMHLMVARYWGDEDNDFTYTSYTMPFDPWAQDPEVAEAEDVTDGAPNQMLLAQQRNRHTLHVRMFRNRFNNRVARPILTWLSKCGVPLTSTSIARTKGAEGEAMVGVTCVLDKLGTPMSNTRWHLVLDFPSGVHLVCKGIGITFPTQMSLVMPDESVTFEQPFDIYQIITLWQAHHDTP